MTCDKCQKTAEKYRDLREAVVGVIAASRPHYDRNRLVAGEVMDRLVEALRRVDGGGE